jgi:hypothetical protein
MRARTDRHRNPAAITTDLARQAGLAEGVDFERGDGFAAGPLLTLYTARFLGDPLKLTLRVLDAVGFYTRGGQPRWTYIAIPPAAWTALGPAPRKAVVAFMYQREGGTEMKGLFA